MSRRAPQRARPHRPNSKRVDALQARLSSLEATFNHLDIFMPPMDEAKLGGTISTERLTMTGNTVGDKKKMKRRHERLLALYIEKLEGLLPSGGDGGDGGGAGGKAAAAAAAPAAAPAAAAAAAASATTAAGVGEQRGGQKRRRRGRRERGGQGNRGMGGGGGGGNDGGDNESASSSDSDHGSGGEDYELDAPDYAQSRFVRDTAVLLRKKQRCVASGTKCGRCWLRPRRCLCSKVQLPVALSRPLRFIVYMSREDYLSGGDDAKLLQVAFPGRTDIFVHGRAGDDARLAAAVAAGDAERTLLLFPDDDAHDSTEWLRARGLLAEVAGGGGGGEDGGCGGAGGGEDGRGGGGRKGSGVCGGSGAGGVGGVGGVGSAAASGDPFPLLTIMVVDGTWRKARRMARHLEEHVVPGIPHVKLAPTVLSVYQRRQSQPDRICTVEAVAMLVGEAGELEAASVLLDLVKLNIEALTYGRDDAGGRKSLWGVGGNPAWYYGRTT